MYNELSYPHYFAWVIRCWRYTPQTFENFFISAHNRDSVPYNDASGPHNRKYSVSTDILPPQKTGRRFHASAFGLAPRKVDAKLNRRGTTCGEFPVRNCLCLGVPSSIMVTEKSGTFSDNGIADLFASNDLESKLLHPPVDATCGNRPLQSRLLLAYVI
jgi:hypothetical protein